MVYMMRMETQKYKMRMYSLCNVDCTRMIPKTKQQDEVCDDLVFCSFLCHREEICQGCREDE